MVDNCYMSRKFYKVNKIDNILFAFRNLSSLVKHFGLYLEYFVIALYKRNNIESKDK